MPGKTAEEMMVPMNEYPHVHPGDTLKEAAEKIEHHRIEIIDKKSYPRALLVLDGEKSNLMGRIRRRSILRALLPDYLQNLINGEPKKAWFQGEVDPDLAQLSFRRFLTDFCEKASMKVEDIMEPFEATVRNTDHRAKIIFIMVAKKMDVVPVMKEEKVIGVVTMEDMFHEVELLLKEKVC